MDHRHFIVECVGSEASGLNIRCERLINTKNVDMKAAGSKEECGLCACTFRRLEGSEPGTPVPLRQPYD